MWVLLGRFLTRRWDLEISREMEDYKWLPTEAEIVGYGYWRRYNSMVGSLTHKPVRLIDLCEDGFAFWIQRSWIAAF